MDKTNLEIRNFTFLKFVYLFMILRVKGVNSTKSHKKVVDRLKSDTENVISFLIEPFV